MWATVLVDSAIWACWGVLCGFAGSRLPDRCLDHDSWLTRVWTFERHGRLYERVAIRRWKDRLPDAGKAFGGRSKRELGGRSSRDVSGFAAETRRAEIVHWLNLSIGPLFLLWNPASLSCAMVLYALVANLPCIAIQRYNRARIERVLARRQARALKPIPSPWVGHPTQSTTPR